MVHMHFWYQPNDAKQFRLTSIACAWSLEHCASQDVCQGAHDLSYCEHRDVLFKMGKKEYRTVSNPVCQNFCQLKAHHLLGHVCRWEAWTPIVGAVVTVLIFVALPTYFYQKQFKAIGNCGADITRYM